MAQTKRKRSTKHRGNAAGMIETRGRTGRPPSPEEKKRATREASRERRLNRRPTWRSSITRSGLIGAVMFVFLLLTDKHRVLPAAALTVIAVIFYIPAGFYLELWMWRRRIRKPNVTKR
jgi:ferric-dicitrate binding protein FerR (iron transport regulator)